MKALLLPKGMAAASVAVRFCTWIAYHTRAQRLDRSDHHLKDAPATEKQVLYDGSHTTFFSSADPCLGNSIDLEADLHKG